jgi:hypothetical protein
MKKHFEPTYRRDTASCISTAAIKQHTADMQHGYTLATVKQHTADMQRYDSSETVKQHTADMQRCHPFVSAFYSAFASGFAQHFGVGYLSKSASLFLSQVNKTHQSMEDQAWP